MADKQDNVVSFENMARERAMTLSVKLVSQMRETLLATVPNLIQSLYEKLDDGLFEQALFEKSGQSDALNNLFFDTMRQLRKQRDAYIKKYVRQVMQGFDQFWNYQEFDQEITESRLQDFDEESLTLVDTGDLEEDLALDGVIAKGMRQYSKEVYALNQRFAAMQGVDEVTDEQNPVAPAAISQAFPASIKGLDVDLRIKLVIYKLFEKEVIQYLGAIYDELNDLLKDAGVLPKLPSRVKKNPVSPAVIRQKEITQEIDDTQSVNAADADQQASMSEGEQAALFNDLRGLLHNSRGSQSPQQANLPKVEATELLSALSGLQTSSNSAADKSLEDVSAEIQQLREKLNGSLGTGGESASKAFNGMDEDTIDVISMLFEFILEDNNLPDAMKALLSRLQIPMLKVAIMDRQFFSNKQHSARRLLNLLAKSVVGWVDDGDRSEEGFYGRISVIVETILNDFHEDLTLFETLYEDFSQFINKEEQGAEIVEERITEVTKGKEKMKLAQIRVAEVINSRTKGVGNLPEVVKELLKDGWKDALTLAFLRQGEDSEKWLRLVGLVDKLLWSVQPKVEISDRQRLLKSIPELLKALRSELVEISYDQHKLGVMLKQLQSCHIKALKGIKTEEPQPEETKQETSAPEVSTESSQTKTAEPAVDAGDDANKVEKAPLSSEKPVPTVRNNLIESPLVSAQKPDKKELDEFDNLASEIGLGAWVEWTSSDDQLMRGKLSWRSSITETLVFVGRKGTKLAELTQNELAELFRMEKARLLEKKSAPLLERAMTSMVDHLKKNASAAG
ncbi:MAG: DUF1631 domain-containing protein [Gammaproteobacteria bacterium]|nr:DUF1631 domain-containing protein [Gammaproteobacteria bacterium]